MAPSITFYLTRHGLSEHNIVEGVFMGRAEGAALLPLGVEQAKNLGTRLKKRGPFDGVISSSLPRTLQTSANILEKLGPFPPPLFPEKAFWELSKGDWEGKKSKPLEIGLEKKRKKDPLGFVYGGGGESYQDVLRRVLPVFYGWLNNFAPGSKWVFVLHGDVLRALLFHILMIPTEKLDIFRIDPCTLHGFSYHPTRKACPFEMLCFNA